MLSFPVYVRLYDIEVFSKPLSFCVDGSTSRVCPVLCLKLIQRVSPQDRSHSGLGKAKKMSDATRDISPRNAENPGTNGRRSRNSSARFVALTAGRQVSS